MQLDETMNVDGVRLRIKITEQAKRIVGEFTFEGTLSRLDDLTQEDIDGYMEKSDWVMAALRRRGVMVENAAITEPGGSE
jgi:hypothetical protein